jgi:hypothetical protein
MIRGYDDSLIVQPNLLDVANFGVQYVPQNLGTNSTLDVMRQETGHRWLSKLHFLDGNGEKSDALLGRDLVHWSFCHNTLASDLEGNLILPKP